MKTKRILALLMAMAMTAGVLGGCSSGDTGSSDTSGDSSTPDTSSGSGEVTEISWWGIGGVAPGNFDAALEDINAYTSEKIGVTVNWTINNWDTYQETFQRMVNGGDTFDIMFASNAYYNRFVQQEAFLDITPYLRLYGLSARELARRIMADVWQTTGITATAGIGTNLYLAKVALDLIAKHEPEGIGELDEASYRQQLWHHQPSEAPLLRMRQALLLSPPHREAFPAS